MLSELEVENRRLIDSFDVIAADGTHDVEIGALTGQVLQSALENENDHDDDSEDEKAEHRTRRKWLPYEQTG